MASGTIKRSGVAVMSVDATIPSTNASINAIIPTGATFLGWLTPIPNQWGGAIWYASTSPSTEIWTNASGSNKSITCPYLVSY